MIKFFSGVVIIAALGGCASMPEVTATYRFPKADTKINVTQSIACSEKPQRVVSAIGVTSKTNYSADWSARANTGTITFNDYGGTLKDSDIGLKFTEDGRLSGINSVATGEGEAIVRSAISLGTAIPGAMVPQGAVMPGKAPPELREIKAKEIQDTCKNLKEYVGASGAHKAGAGDVVTLHYSIDIVYGYIPPVVNQKHKVTTPAKWTIEPNLADNPNGYLSTDGGKLITLKVNLSDRALYKSLPAAHFPIVLKWAHADFTKNPEWVNHPKWTGDENAPSGFTAIKLNKTANYQLEVDGPNADFSVAEMVWAEDDVVPVQQWYPLLVPKGEIFGQQKFVLALSPAGRVTQLEYSANTGVTGLLTSSGNVVNAFPTVQSEAAAAKAKADLIAQEQRLAVCTATPSKCK